MKSLKLRKLVAATVAALTIASMSPIGASAEWRQDATGWWNTEGDSYSTGWRLIDSQWYYFDSVGYMKTGWVNDNGTWYYLQSSGAMKTGWANDNGTWYYLQSSGAMKTGWVKDNGTWYYLQSSGAMKTGWINDNGTWYFATVSGAMQTGVVEVDGKVYFLAANGAMQTGNVTINGVVYTFALDGHAVGDKIPTPTLRFTSAGVAATTNPTDKTDTDKKGTDTTTTTTSTSSGGAHHHGGGSGSSTPADRQQRAIDNQLKSEVTLTVPAPVAKSATEAVIKPVVNFTPGVSTNETIGGVAYSVKKDVYVTLDDGTDVGVDGSTFKTNGEFVVPNDKHGTVTTVVTLTAQDGSNTVFFSAPQSARF